MVALVVIPFAVSAHPELQRLQDIGVPILGIIVGVIATSFYAHKSHTKEIQRDVSKSVRPILDARMTFDTIDEITGQAELALEESNRNRMELVRTAFSRIRDHANNGFIQAQHAIQHWKDIDNEAVNSAEQAFTAGLEASPVGQRQRIQKGGTN